MYFNWMESLKIRNKKKILFSQIDDNQSLIIKATISTHTDLNAK